jgi:TolB-like protein/cytochrome c-type biogenesis protein CcmH/NrfG
MSGDPEQEYFSDGITEEIITALSKTPTVFVIARTSSFKYKGKEIDVRTVGRELGVHYVLEGSVRKSEDRLRVTAQLVDAKSGNHIWAERYDRDLKDIFAIQDEITMKIITELRVKLTSGEQARLVAKGTNNLEAYLKLLQALDYFFRLNREDNIRARQMAEEAIASDPGFVRAYEILAHTHFMDFWLRTSKSPKQSLALASKLAQKALSMDASSSGAHNVLAVLYLLKRQHERAIAESEQALALVPNSADYHTQLGRILCYSGMAEKAIPLLKKALRLNPIPKGWHLYTLGFAYNLTGQYEEAIEASRKAVEIEPKNIWSRLVLTQAYSFSGREEEASAEAKEIVKMDPKFSVDYFAKIVPFKNQADKESQMEALRKAGLK